MFSVDPVLTETFEYLSVYSLFNVTEGARASGEDQTEGGPMESKKETPGLSEPGSGQ